MSRNSLSELEKPLDESPVAIGGGYRVARIFIPVDKSSVAIRLTGRHDRATARRQLARVIEPRRMVS